MNPKENTHVYGVDLSQKVTPIMVRDAIVTCFYHAHKDVLDLAREYFGCTSNDEFEEMKREHIMELIEAVFMKVGGDFSHPTKTSLQNVLSKLEKLAAIYREPAVIEKHVSEIMQLIDKIE